MTTRLSYDSIFLLLGVFLLVLTMVLHPSAGGFEKLSTKPFFAILSHSIAVFSVPFMGIGFLALSRQIGLNLFLSKMAFGVMATGLVATMLAATLNGLALPIFAMSYKGASPEVIESLRPIFAYNRALNMAFDYILIGAFIISTICWSAPMLRNENFPNWLGWIGITMGILAIISSFTGYSFITLVGLRVFVFTWVLWIICVSYYMSLPPTAKV